MKNCSICVILDRHALQGRNLAKAAEDALAGGAGIIQYRDKVSCDADFIKEALILQKIVGGRGGKFIVNDRVDIARAIGADGVHIGQDDMPLAYARKIMAAKIIGVSAHTCSQALDAEKGGADYIGVGPVFRTGNKPGVRPIGRNTLRSVAKNARIPVFAIGGINRKSIRTLKGAGIRRIAVISAAVNSPDICGAVAGLKRELEMRSPAPRYSCKPGRR